jgi:hypothetical protein
MKVDLCQPYLFEDITVLARTSIVIPGECASEIVNQITLVYILSLILSVALGVFMKSSHMYTIILGVATVFLLPSFYRLITLQQAHTVKEAFQNAPVDTVAGVTDVIGGGTAPGKFNDNTFTSPTAKNPFMNVLIDEIKYNPTKPAAVSISGLDVATSLDDFFRTEFNRDPTDVFGRSQSQRQFVTMPATTIPNDQGSYQNWLYKIPGKTCKEGGRDACLPGTDGAAMPWLNVDR